MHAKIGVVARHPRAFILGCIALSCGCAAIVGIEATTDERPLPDGGDGAVVVEAGPLEDSAPGPGDGGDQLGNLDGEVPLSGGDGGGVDDAGNPVLGDAGPDSSACFPVTTFIPTNGGTGTVCNPNNVLPSTSGATGLDFAYTDKLGIIDGRNVTSCIGANFAGSLLHVLVRAASTAKACDVTCSGAECGTGHNHNVFVGSAGVFKYAGTMALTSSYATFDVTVPVGVVDPTQVVVCRSGYGTGRDDVLVSFIAGICKN
jgi:hypothetical protein